MADEIKAPREGFSTLAAQFTRADVDRIIELVARFRASGWPDDRILSAMRVDLADYSETTVEILFATAAGSEIPDSLQPGQVESERRIKEGTLELTFVPPLPAILEPNQLIRHGAKLWTISGLTDKSC